MQRAVASQISHERTFDGRIEVQILTNDSGGRTCQERVEVLSHYPTANTSNYY